MKGPVRAVLTTCVAALTGGALVFTPSVLPATMRTIEVVGPVTLAADRAAIAQGGPLEPFSPSEVRATLALIEQLAPVTGLGTGTVTVRLANHEVPGTATSTVPIAITEPHAAPADDSSQNPAANAALDDPVTLNAASNIIDGVYAVSRYWATYVSLELGPWLINWIPFGYLISDQIYIWYPDFVLPTVDSFVYDFLDPVVNDPLNPGVWFDGINAIINTAATGIVNGIVDEIGYIVSFGWFPIPLPPLPDFPLPRLASESTPAAALLASGEAEMAATDASEETTEVGNDEPAIERIDPGTTEATEASTQDGIDEEAGDFTEAELAEQPEQNPETPVEDADESAGEVTDESPAETSDESQDPADGTADDEPDAADESGDTERPGDGDNGAGEKSSANGSDGMGASGSGD